MWFSRGFSLGLFPPTNTEKQTLKLRESRRGTPLLALPLISDGACTFLSQKLLMVFHCLKEKIQVHVPHSGLSHLLSLSHFDLTSHIPTHTPQQGFCSVFLPEVSTSILLSSIQTALSASGNALEVLLYCHVICKTVPDLPSPQPLPLLKC